MIKCYGFIYIWLIDVLGIYFIFHMYTYCISIHIIGYNMVLGYIEIQGLDVLGYMYII